jgi:hypothetical protein
MQWGKRNSDLRFEPVTTRTLTSAATDYTATSMRLNDKNCTDMNRALKNRIPLIIRNFRRRDNVMSVIWNSLKLAAEKQNVHCIPAVRIRRLCVTKTTESRPQNWGIPGKRNRRGVCVCVCSLWVVFLSSQSTDTRLLYTYM